MTMMNDPNPLSKLHAVEQALASRIDAAASALDAVGNGPALALDRLEAARNSALGRLALLESYIGAAVNDVLGAMAGLTATLGEALAQNELAADPTLDPAPSLPAPGVVVQAVQGVQARPEGDAPRAVNCPACAGAGLVAVACDIDTYDAVCTTCQGRGRVPASEPPPSAADQVTPPWGHDGPRPKVAAALAGPSPNGRPKGGKKRKRA